jgi:hypothetical protein
MNGYAIFQRNHTQVITQLLHKYPMPDTPILMLHLTPQRMRNSLRTPLHTKIWRVFVAHCCGNNPSLTASSLAQCNKFRQSQAQKNRVTEGSPVRYTTAFAFV